MYINSNEISFKHLVPNRNKVYATKQSKERPVAAFDTETYKGWAILLADSTGRHVDIHNIEDALDFMTRKRFRDSHNFFYNMKFDFASIVKYLPKEELRELYKLKECDFGKYKLKYIPGKIFKIASDKHSYTYYDIAQFYLMKLGDAAEQFLGKKKNEQGVDAARMNVDKQYWNDNYDDIVKYCINDCVLTKELGDLLQETYKRAFGYAPQNYISVANVSKRYFARHTAIPDIRRVDRKHKFMAFECYHGGRFELLKKGWFDHVSSLDIVSAYSFHMGNLTQCTDGEWVSVKEVDYDSLHGFYVCTVDVPEYILPPFIVNAPGGIKLFPKGKFMTHLTLNEIKHYSDYCDIKVHRGSEFKSDDKTRPFHDTIKELFELKNVTPKKDFRYMVYKTTSNSFYGSFYEKYKEGKVWQEAKTFNPFYASEITADTRVQVYEEALRHHGKVIGFATDAVIIEGAADYPEKGRLGDFTLDTQGEACILQTGVNLIGEKLKCRGMERGTPLMKGGVEYDNIFDYMRKEPDKTVYESDSVRPLTLGAAVMHHKKWSVEDINVWHTFHRSTNINKEVKRVWDDKFKGGGEMFERHIESKAKDVSVFEAAQKAHLERVK